MSETLNKWLLDGTTPVVELREWEGEPDGVLVAFPGTRKREWVDRSRLIAFGDPAARPKWLEHDESEVTV